jgi:hypothetical protein
VFPKLKLRWVGQLETENAGRYVGIILWKDRHRARNREESLGWQSGDRSNL